MGLNPALGIRVGRLPAGPKNLITDVLPSWNFLKHHETQLITLI